MTPTLPAIFHYTEYRAFLKDYYQARKATDSKFSQRYIIAKIGASSAGWFSDLVNGRLNLSSGHRLKLARLLGLKPNEEAYFEALIAFDQAGSIDERNHCFRKVLSFKEVKPDLVGKDKFEFYSSWWHAAIRELLFFHDFKDDYAALGRMLSPPIKAEQARQSIELLDRLGFIARQADGRYRPEVATLKKDSSVKSLHQANVLKSAMELGIAALDAYDADSRDISNVTLSFSEEAFAKAKEEIKALRKRLLALTGSDPNPTKVYQCSIQFIPLSR